MSDYDPDSNVRDIFAITEEEAAAIEAGDIDRYVAVLSDDAVFMPQNVDSKTGDDLRQWLRDFLNRVTIKYVEFAHGETVIRDDLACHAYTCRWTATPKSGGAASVMSFKGLHVLRRHAGRHWRISRSIWNTNPITTA